MRRGLQGRLLFQRAGRLRDMRRDVVHQRGREGIVRLQVKLFEPCAHCIHIFRIGAGFDDRRDEGGKLRRLPATFREELRTDEVEPIEGCFLFSIRPNICTPHTRQAWR